MVSASKRSRDKPVSEPRGYLDVDVQSASRNLLRAALELHAHHMTPEGLVDGGVIMAFGNRLGGLGARHAVLPGQSSQTIESNTNFLRPCRTDRLAGEARLLSRGANVSQWRTSVFDGAGTLVAEVTQTEAVAPGEDSGADGPRPMTSAEPVILPVVQNEAGAERAASTTARERLQQIFQGACEVIARKGFAEATVRDIATAAGMPVPTMYQYINSKEDLLFLIYETYMGDINARVKASISTGMPPREKLENAIRVNIRSNDEYHRYVKVMFQETRSLRPEDRARVEALDAAYIAIWKEILEDGIAAGAFRIDNVELVANFIFFMSSVWPLRYWSIGGHGVETVTDHVTRFILGAVGAE